MPLQTSIRAEGFRSLREGEPVEFDVEPGEDGRNKAINVSGPGGAPPLVNNTKSLRSHHGLQVPRSMHIMWLLVPASHVHIRAKAAAKRGACCVTQGAPKRPQLQQRRGQLQQQQPPSPMMLASAAAQQQQLQHQYAAAAQQYGYPQMYPGSYPGAGSYPPGPGMGGMYQQQRPHGIPPGAMPGGGMAGMPGGMRPPLGIPGSMPVGMPEYGGYPGQQQQGQPGQGRGGGRWPGGGVADRRPPPGTPGVSSGLQVGCYIAAGSSAQADWQPQPHKCRWPVPDSSAGMQPGQSADAGRIVAAGMPAS